MIKMTKFIICVFAYDECCFLSNKPIKSIHFSQMINKIYSFFIIGVEVYFFEMSIFNHSFTCQSCYYFNYAFVFNDIFQLLLFICCQIEYALFSFKLNELSFC